MVSSITPTRRTRAGWTASGDCISGSTARHSGATKPASGFAAVTSTTANPNPKARQKTAALEQFGGYMAGQLQPKNPTGCDEVTQPTGFIVVCVLAFVGGVSGTAYFCRSMCCEMEMPGGWTMSMMWMRMPGQTWFASALSFLFMWLAMMVALMLPSALEAETLKGGSDEELLAWAFANGRQPSEEEIEVWNAFMTKRGWHDAGTQWLNERLAEIGRPPGTVQTMFEFIDLDEGRRQAGPR